MKQQSTGNYEQPFPEHDLSSDPSWLEKEPKNHLGSEGNKHVQRGRAAELAGRLQEKAGELTGNEEMQARGAERRLQGDVREGSGRGEHDASERMKQVQQR